RFRVGRRAPELAGQKRRSDLDLSVRWTHVEQSRGPDRPSRRVPHLRIDDRLATRHRVFGLADEPQRVVDRCRRLPGEIAAELFVAHGVEDPRRVTLVDRLEGEPAPLQRDGGEIHVASGVYTTPAARSRFTSGRRTPSTRVSTVSVSAPSTGAAVVGRPGVPCRRMGTPIIFTVPALRCGSATTMPRAFRCSLSHTSGTVRMRPAGTPADSSRLSQSAAGRAPRISFSSGTSVARCSTREATVAYRGSFASSGRSSAAQQRSHSESLAAPMTRYASAALKTS